MRARAASYRETLRRWAFLTSYLRDLFPEGNPEALDPIDLPYYLHGRAETWRPEDHQGQTYDEAIREYFADTQERLIADG